MTLIVGFYQLRVVFSMSTCDGCGTSTLILRANSQGTLDEAIHHLGMVPPRPGGWSSGSGYRVGPNLLANYLSHGGGRWLVGW